MLKMIGCLLFAVSYCALAHADDANRPNTHPCTGENIPLTTEQSVVSAIECLYKGRVAKVTQVQTSNGFYYELRVLIPGGRIKNIDVNPETGLPLDPAELKAVTQ